MSIYLIVPFFEKWLENAPSGRRGARPILPVIPVLSPIQPNIHGQYGPPTFRGGDPLNMREACA